MVLFIIFFTQGNTIKNIENELDSILSTGFYNFQLADDVQPNGIFLIFQLRFQCRQTPQPQPECNENEGIKQRWTHEQIDNFVRKLRFLDAEKEGREKIKLFLHLNTVSNINDILLLNCPFSLLYFI